MKGMFKMWMAYLLIKNCNQNRYGSLVTKLQTEFATHHNHQYPATVTTTTDIWYLISDILSKYQHDYKEKHRGPKQGNHKPLRNHDSSLASGANRTSFAHRQATGIHSVVVAVVRRTIWVANVQRKEQGPRVSGQQTEQCNMACTGIVKWW